MPKEEYWRWTASEAVASLKKGDIKPVELIGAARSRIEAIDPIVNALPIRCFERATEQAGTADPNSLLAGLPIAVKDYNDIGGVRTTYGSPIYTDYVPKTSDATVSRLEENGAIPIAKSNVPEWAGGHTFNPVNGLTRNPWHTERSAGGSSGGSGAAWQVAKSGSRQETISAVACARRPASTALSDSGRVQASYRAAKGFKPSTLCGSKARWPGMLPTSR